MAMHNKGIIIHLDDEQKNLDDSLHFKNQLELDLELITCLNEKDFDAAVASHHRNLKCLIFDLLGKHPNAEEVKDGHAKFLDNIEKNFARFNIPIFIYSGYLQSIDDKFENCGTVFKMDKDDGIAPVYERIKLLHDSGFIDVFCPGGYLENEFHKDLHQAFTLQFTKNNHIPDIISLIQSTTNEELYKPKVKKVFERIAVRSLLTKLLSPELNENGDLIEEFASSTEHYVQRINKIPIWTGDIFKHNDSDEHLFILTPRCNAVRTNTYLVCPFILGDVITKSDKIEKMLTADPHVSGYDRYLPPCPIFKGGKLKLSSYSICNSQTLIEDYSRVISLSDELTNEILGKFGSYFFRSGITPWDSSEIARQIKEEKSKAKQ